MSGTGRYGQGGGFTSRDGLSARQPLFGSANRDQLQINIDPGFDIDHAVDDLRSHVQKLKGVASQISEENQLQRQILDSLEEAMEKVKGALKGTMKRLNKAYRDSQSNHVTYLVLFGLALFFVVYSWHRVSAWLRWIF